MKPFAITFGKGMNQSGPTAMKKTAEQTELLSLGKAINPGEGKFWTQTGLLHLERILCQILAEGWEIILKDIWISLNNFLIYK